MHKRYYVFLSNESILMRLNKNSVWLYDLDKKGLNNQGSTLANYFDSVLVLYTPIIKCII